jgi:hypothetical protein
MLNGAYGTAGQVLTSNGSGSAPSWQTPASQQWTAGNVSTVDSPLSVSGGHLGINLSGYATTSYVTSACNYMSAADRAWVTNYFPPKALTYDVIFVADVGPPQVKYTMHFVDGVFTGLS